MSGTLASLSEPSAAIEQDESPQVALEDVVPTPGVDVRAPRTNVLPALGTARVLAVSRGHATIVFRGRRDPVEAAVAPEVDADLIADAARNGDAVLVEQAEGEAPVVVAALQTRRPSELRLRAATVTIEGEDEVLLRSGRGAVRLRADGDIEVVGGRISAASRGIFRIVGRILRLN